MLYSSSPSSLLSRHTHAPSLYLHHLLCSSTSSSFLHHEFHYSHQHHHSLLLMNQFPLISQSYLPLLLTLSRSLRRPSSSTATHSGASGGWKQGMKESLIDLHPFSLRASLSHLFSLSPSSSRFRRTSGGRRRE